MKYTIDFYGRSVRAIGTMSQCITTRVAETPQAALLAVYNEFEHVSGPLLTDENSKQFIGFDCTPYVYECTPFAEGTQP